MAINFVSIIYLIALEIGESLILVPDFFKHDCAGRRAVIQHHSPTRHIATYSQRILNPV